MRKQKTVLFVTQSFGSFTNGPGTYTDYLWKAFNDHEEIDFHIVAYKSTISHPKIHVVENAGTASKSLFQSKKIYENVSDKAIEVATSLGSGTIIHCNVCIYPKLIGKGFKIIGQINDYDSAVILKKIAYTVKTFGLRRLISLFSRNRVEKKMVRNQDLTICNSDYTKRIVSKSYGLKPSHNIITIHKAVDLEQFSKSTKTSDVQKSQFKLIFVGSNWRRKGLKTVIKSLKGTNECITLSVVGPKSNDVNTILQPMVNDLGLKNRVSFLDKVEREELKKLYWESDCFIMPSFDEAFGVVLLEAMASGLPVISSPVGGVVEIVNQNDLGLLVKPGDDAELTSAINEIYSNPEKREILRLNGFKRVKDFSKDIMIDKLTKVYLEN